MTTPSTAEGDARRDPPPGRRRVAGRLLPDGRIVLVLQPDVGRAVGAHLDEGAVVTRASTCEWRPPRRRWRPTWRRPGHVALEPGTWVLDFRPVGGPRLDTPGRWAAHERDEAIRFEIAWLARHWPDLAVGPAPRPIGPARRAHAALRRALARIFS